MTSVNEEVLERPHLDLRILSSPSFAIQSAAEQVVHMGELAREHVEISMGSVFDVSEEKIRRSDALEKTLDVFEKDLTEYLVHLSHESLTEQQIQTVSHLLFTVSDLERIGDHCDNIAELASSLVQGHVQLSGDAVEEDRADISDDRRDDDHGVHQYIWEIDFMNTTKEVDNHCTRCRRFCCFVFGK